MEWHEIFSILGGTALISTIITFVFNLIVNGSKARKKRNKELADIIVQKDLMIKLGLQALLRDRLLEIYDKWSVKKYAPIQVRDNFMNLYDKYHNLGANGVMDDIRDKFLSLPLEKEKITLNETKKRKQS